MSPEGLRRLPAILFCLLPFVLLWALLVNNLRVEWDLNPQYSYGWLVPFLCGALLWRRLQPSGSPLVSIAKERDGQNPIARFAALVIILLAATYLPTRLVQESAPEWRMVSWSLGIATVGLTLAAVRVAWGSSILKATSFPILFFLVSVPWPSFVEAPLIQLLTRTNAASVVEVLTIIGVPAIQQGNIIEVATGPVGVEEACSGIRSFQSNLMISLFLGEYFALPVVQRIILVPIGFALSLVLNIIRTTFLTYIAARDGVHAIDAYHDPAGLVILVVSFGMLWGLTAFLNRIKREPTAPPDVATAPASEQPSPLSTSPPSNVPIAVSTAASVVSRTTDRIPGRGILRFSGLLLAWMAVSEGLIAGWYHSRESSATQSIAWDLSLPKTAPSFKEIPLHPKTISLLRFDSGHQGSWTSDDGIRWMGFVFEWYPGRVAGYLAKRHTPDICLPASGAVLKSGPLPTPFQIHELDLPLRHYVFESHGSAMHVFQCRWEAGGTSRAELESGSETLRLLRGVWMGRGKQGQKVMEFIAIDPPSQEVARESLRRQLTEFITIRP